MKINKQSSALPEWLSSLATMIKSKKSAKAEMQVGNLPTVDWNDNTFYVDVVDNNAILYNQYGNEVLNIQVNELGKSEDEDVVSAIDKYLNEHYVTASINSDGDTSFEKKVTANEEDVDVDLDSEMNHDDMDMVFEQELEKVASAEDGMPEDEGSENGGESTNDGTTTEQTVTASVEEEVQEEAVPVVEETVSDDEPTLDVDPVVTEQPEEKAGEISQGVEDEVGEVSEGVEDVATDNEVVAPVVEDEVADDTEEAVDDFSFDDVDADPVEEVATEENACDCDCNNCDETATEEENGFVSLASYNRLVARLNALEKTVKAFQAEQRAYTEIPNDAYDLNCQEEEVKHFNENAEATQKVIDKEHELDMSKMSDRAKLNENFIKDVVEQDNVEQTEAVNEVVAPAEVPAEETTEETPVEEVVEETAPVEETVETVEEPSVEEVTPAEETPVEDVMTDAELVALDDKQFEEFSNQVCPFCHKQSLTPVDEADGVIGVRCEDCGKEFAVGDEVYTTK